MDYQVLAIAAGSAGLSEGRGFIDRVLSAAGFDAETRYQVTVATNEAVSNAMEHGVPCEDGFFHLAAGVDSGAFVFTVRDCGEFEDTAAHEPDPVADRGRGFAFMNLLMDDVRVDARPGETVLRLAKHLPGESRRTTPAEPSAGDRNTQVVGQVFEAFAARDVERMIQLVDRGVMLEPLSTEIERRAPYLGVRGLRRYLRDLDETWDRFELTIAGLRAGGDYVVALGRIHAQRRDLVADDPAGFAFKVRDRRVVWAKVYRSHDEALAAAGLAG